MDLESNQTPENNKIDVPKKDADVSVIESNPVTSVKEDVLKIEADDSASKCEPVTSIKEDVPEIGADISVTGSESEISVEEYVVKMEGGVSVTKRKPVTSVEEENKSENVLLASKHNANNASKDSAEAKENVNNETDESNLHYENGICIYTDPESKCQFIWDDGKQEWVPRDTPASFSDKDYEYDGKTYTYTDKETNIKYMWNEEKKEWKESANSDEKSLQDQNEEDESKMKNPDQITTKDVSDGCYSFENDTHIYTDPSDGSKYFWDREKNAWFPRVDDDFLARYQMNYGFVDPNANDPKPEEKKEQPPPKEAEKRKAPQEPGCQEDKSS